MNFSISDIKELISFSRQNGVSQLAFGDLAVVFDSVAVETAKPKASAAPTSREDKFNNERREFQKALFNHDE